MIDIQNPLVKPGTHEWEELRLDQIGAALQKYRRPGGGRKMPDNRLQKGSKPKNVLFGLNRGIW